jgi:pyruvate/2-oxoacid:ferredoxin oxidoreductase alpha subunit
VATAQGTTVSIDGPSDVDLWADGEVLGPLPIRLESVAAAAQVAGASTSGVRNMTGS